MEKKDYLDKALDFIFTKNNIKYLIILFLIGFILRAIVANNFPPNADEMLHAPHAINFINSGKLQIMDQDPIWFFLTDLNYKIFGINMLAARFLAVLFGSLSIFILYLIVKTLYGKKIALISSILLTFSSFHILMSLAEMDVAMMFFVLLSLFYFIKALKENKNKYLIISYIFLGIAILVKQIAIMFIPAFLIYYIYYKLKNKQKLAFKQLFIFIIVMLVISLPVLTFNYLLYKDKGLVDLQFSRFFGIAKETYAPIEATLKPFSLHDLFFSYDGQIPGILHGISFFFQFDKIIFLLGIIGAIIAIVRKKPFILLLFLSFLFPFLFLAGTSLLEYHFIFGVPILSLFAAIFIDFLSEKISRLNINKNIVITSILILILVFNISFLISREIFKKGEVTKMIDYKNENIEDGSLVIVDSRVYRGRIVWIFNDKHYLEASQFIDLLNKITELPGESADIKTYFIECVTDDCGWGTINSQPEFNRTMEDLTGFFKNNTNFLTTINTKDDDKYFNVYQGNLLLKNSVFDIADSTHEWFYYPLRYNKDSFDDYSSKGIDKALDLLAHLVLYIEILISLLTIVLLIFVLVNEENKAE